MQLSVLLLTYNRPQLVRRQLDIILKINSTINIYISVDGPKDNSRDTNNVKQVHAVIGEYQKKYPGKIKTLFSEKNLGCALGVERGITWFFSKVSSGIILEDDCQPNETFFRFCGELLEKYENDDRVGMISGTNPLTSVDIPDSYFFSNQSIIWGWATWADKWQDYARTKKIATDLLCRPDAQQAIKAKTSDAYFKTMKKVVAGEIDTWDFIWYLSNIITARYCIIPRQNLVSNVGFNADATHTKIKTTQADLPRFNLTFPLQHPATFLPLLEFDKQYLGMVKPWKLGLSVIEAYVLAWKSGLKTKTKKN